MKLFTILLNGKEKQISSKTLTSLLIEENFNAAVVATAVNGLFVPIAKRSEIHLKLNDKVEIVSPMQGG